MARLRYPRRRWNAAAAAAWAEGLHDKAIDACIATLERDIEVEADAFVQTGFYLFQMSRFLESAAIFARGIERFPDHPMMLLSLGGALTRAGRHAEAVTSLERFIALGFRDATAFDALAHSHAQLGNRIKAGLFGTMALHDKDVATKERWGTPPLRPVKDADRRQSVISFTLWGADPRYLRGALQNVLAARDLYKGWVCRFYADDSVDALFLEVLAAEGAEVLLESGADERVRLSRRFLVASDPAVGRFLVRDCDSVVSAREAAAVNEWVKSKLPFHVMRDWYTHTDPMLAGMWGGLAGAFPDFEGALKSFRDKTLPSVTWDQLFLRERVWPAIRDQAMIHDRCFNSYNARPFPTGTPPGREHVGQNEFASDPGRQASALAAFADRVPALKLSARPFQLKLRTKL